MGGLDDRGIGTRSIAAGNRERDRVGLELDLAPVAADVVHEHDARKTMNLVRRDSLG